MNFNDLIRYKALHLKYVTDNQGLVDMVLDENNPNVTGNLPLKNVCAMIPLDLFDDLTSTCALLDISKRVFIQEAIFEALAKANKILIEERLEEHLVERSSIGG